MICIYCSHSHTTVANSRPHKKRSSVWRRRQCKKCHMTFTSYESPLLDHLLVLGNKKNQPFSHTKLLLSIAACFEHQTTRRAEYSEAIATTIAEKIARADGQELLTPAFLAETAYTVLARFDKRAAIQYAARHSAHLEKHL